MRPFRKHRNITNTYIYMYLRTFYNVIYFADLLCNGTFEGANGYHVVLSS